MGNVTGDGTISVGNSSGASAKMTVSSITQSSVSVLSTGSLTISSNSSPTTNTINSLTIDGNGTLNLTNNTLLIDYGSNPDPIASIEQWIKNGYWQPVWSSIVSSSIASDDVVSGLSYGIGYADWADPVISQLACGYHRNQVHPAGRRQP